MSTNRFEFRRFLSTTRSQRLAVLVAIAGLSFAFALFLGLFVGAWLIVPFAGLEVACVALAFWWIEQRSSDCDTVEIGEASVSVIRQRGAKSEQHTFSRAWVQIGVERDRDGRECGVSLQQSGKSVCVGEFLGSREIGAAARELKSALSRPTWAAA